MRGDHALWASAAAPTTKDCEAECDENEKGVEGMGSRRHSVHKHIPVKSKMHHLSACHAQRLA